MSLVVIIVVVIVILILLLVFTFGFFLGLGRKKKDLKLLEKEQEEQKKTQASIIQHFLYEKEEVIKDEADFFPVKVINRGYKRIKKFLRFKKLIYEIKELDVIWYLRKYLLSYIGIAVFVLGFGYFVKYSINSAFINIAGRFIITILISIFLIVLSHLIRKKHKTFSSIIMGGAIGSLFITFTISFYNYNIFTTFQIFSIYFLLTFFSVVISFIYRRNELMLLAILAGFFAPFISGIDYHNFIVIIIYVTLLNIGGLFITLKNKNIFIRMLFAIFSGVYMILWVYNCYQTNYFYDFGTGLTLITILYFVLIVIAIGNSIKNNVQDIKPLEYSLTIIINIIYYTVGIYILNKLNPNYRGAFTALLVVFNLLILIITLLIKKDLSKKIVYLFGVISVLFLILIPPVQLVGRSITMIWAIESVLLLWFSIKLDIKVLKIVSVFLMIGLTVGFIMDVKQALMEISYFASYKTLFLNKNFITGMLVTFGFFGSASVLNKQKDDYLFKPLKVSFLKNIVIVFGVATLYFSFYTELLYFFTIKENDANLLNLYIGIYNFAFILFANIIFVFINNKSVKFVSAFTSIISVVLFFSFYLFQIIIVREHMLNDFTISINKFLKHILIIAELLFILFFSYIKVRNISIRAKKISKWLSIILAIIILSTEIDHLLAIYNYDGTPVSSIIIKAHYFYYTLFWMISSFFIAFTGLIFKDKELIRISMLIIIISLIKIFVFDFSNVSMGERIINLILAGFVLLFVAYSRQKLFEKKHTL